MNPETNEFYEATEPLDPTHLSFLVGEEVVLKGHVFKITHIGMAPHELRLKPVRKAETPQTNSL